MAEPASQGHEEGKDDERIDRKMSMLKATLEWLPFVGAMLLLVLAGLADLTGGLEDLVPASRVGIYVAVAFSALLAFVLRLVAKVNKLEKVVVSATDAQLAAVHSSKQWIEGATFVDAFALAAEQANRTDLVRVYACTSKLISQQMQAGTFRTATMQLMVNCADPVRAPDLRSEIKLTVEYTWTDRIRSGAISELTVRQFDYYPTEWFVIFDDRLMIYAPYVFDQHANGKVGVLPRAFLVRGIGEGGRLIESRISTFDRLFDASSTNFGKGELEGNYCVREGQVFRQEVGSTEWKEVRASDMTTLPGTSLT